MLSEKLINKVNKLIENRVFNYNDNLLYGINDITANVDYKIKLLGYKQMYGAGQSYNYLMVSVEFVKYNNEISKYTLSKLPKTTSNDYLSNFKRKLSSEISTFLSIFVDADNKVIITNYTDNTNSENEIVLEQEMSDLATRTVVRDITFKVKNKKRGFFYLPTNGDLYNFNNLPFGFSVELTLRTDMTLDGFNLNGYYVPDEDVIEILIIFNPQKIESKLYDLIGELNELVRHEIEHGIQSVKGTLPKNKKEPEKPFKYYNQIHEVTAQYKGFKRLSKLTKKPIKVIAENWFKKNTDIHGLTNKEVNIIIENILNCGKKPV
jgi:hypothetical protein